MDSKKLLEFPLSGGKFVLSGGNFECPEAYDACPGGKFVAGGQNLNFNVYLKVTEKSYILYPPTYANFS